MILTAAHCTDSWASGIAAGTLDSVGVSFDQNNQVGGVTTNATFYVRGGVPISFPAKDAPFETFDYGLVVFFYAHAERHLPAYARPAFVRLVPEMDVTGTLKQRKASLVADGYDPSRVRDPVLVRDDARRTYVPLTPPLREAIRSGRYRL